MLLKECVCERDTTLRYQHSSRQVDMFFVLGVGYRRGEEDHGVLLYAVWDEIYGRFTSGENCGAAWRQGNDHWQGKRLVVKCCVTLYK